jgi:hypothetical protein
MLSGALLGSPGLDSVFKGSLGLSGALGWGSPRLSQGFWQSLECSKLLEALLCSQRSLGLFRALRDSPVISVALLGSLDLSGFCLALHGSLELSELSWSHKGFLGSLLLTGAL